MLTLVPTPIGNLGDVTLRALQALAQADVLMCEDVRVGKRLLFLLRQNPLMAQNFQGIFENKKFLSFHSHNEKEFLDSVAADFFTRNSVVFMSDAGMPCICDPGALLVRHAVKNGIDYDVLPGCSAGVNAYCSCGSLSEGFLFAGFLPHKRTERRSRITNLIDVCARFEQKISIVAYESPHRILQTMKDLSELAPGLELFAVKEMTKTHQKRFIGTCLEVNEALQTANLSGEWVLVLEPGKESRASLNATQIEQMDLPPKIKAKILSKMGEGDAKSLYEKILAQKDGLDGRKT